MGFMIQFINILFTVLWVAILARVLLSWVDPQVNMRVTQIIHEITEPILAPIRNVVPTIGMFDISPIIAILLLNVIQYALLAALAY
jgi:YggT family protein